MGFGIKVMPGVRIRASSRGISAGVGPRVARVNVGTRGVGVSSGVGPFGTYQSLSGRSRGGGGGRSAGYSTGPTQREIAAQKREAKLRALVAEMEEEEQAVDRLTRAHLETFPEAKRPTAPPPEPVDRAAIHGRLSEQAGLAALEAELGGGDEPPHAPDPEPVNQGQLRKEFRREARREVPMLRFSERSAKKREADELAAKAAAEEAERREAERQKIQAELDQRWRQLESMRTEIAAASEAEATAEETRRAEEHDRQQHELDAEWERLLGNDPITVIGTLEDAFADNSAPAAPIDVEGDRVTVAMRFQGPEIVPPRKPESTPSGKPTMKKRTKTQLNDVYLEALSSHVLATVKEAFAVAPKIDTTSVLVLREEIKGKAAGHLAAIYFGNFRRSELPEAVAPDTLPQYALEDAEEARLNLRGVAQEVAPIDLSDDPDLQDVLSEIAEGLEVPPLGAK